MDLLYIFDGDKLHHVHIKDFDSFMFNKTKNKNKKFFNKVVSIALAVKMF